VGIGFKYLQQIEVGRGNLTIEFLVKLTNHLNVRVKALFEPTRTQSRRSGRPPRGA